MTEYITKDSGERQEFDSGMKRDTEAGKPRFDLLIPDGVPYEDQLLTRFAMLLARGAEKYDARNWEQANSAEEVARAKSSAFRHFMQWLCGEVDEDHAVATMFNIMVVETVGPRVPDDSSHYARVADRILSNRPGVTVVDETEDDEEMVVTTHDGVVRQIFINSPGGVDQVRQQVQESFDPVKREDLRFD